MSIYTGLSPLTRVPLSDVPLPPVDPAMRSWPGEEVEAGGVRLHVRRTPGSAEATAVYVHGLNGSASNWTDLAHLLSGQVNGIAVDLPGFGRSKPADGFEYSPPANAELLAAFLRG